MILTAAFGFYLLCGFFRCDVSRGVIVPRSNDAVVTTGNRIARMSRNEAIENLTPALDPLVFTESGVLKGYFMDIGPARTIYAFESIPYAQPPINFLRFKNPLPVTPWKGIRDALSPSPYCLQLHPLRGGRVLGSEDCLYLNIYTPHINDRNEHRRKFPVIIFIHGGSFFWGGANEYGPSYILEEDVVLVTINYRLGPLGFLSTGDDASPGNYGLKDQALAIKWVHQNIAEFGGDKNQITLMGQSAGAASIHLQMISQTSVAKGLFKNVIALSGTAFNNWSLQSPEYSLYWTKKLASVLNCPTNLGSQILMNCLMSINPNTIAAQHPNLLDYFMFPLVAFGPTVENRNVSESFLTEYPEVAYEKGIVAPVPLILTNMDQESEFVFLAMKNTLTLQYYLRNFPVLGPNLLDIERFRKNSSDIFSKVMDGYRSKYKDSLQGITSAASFRYFHLASRKAMKYHSAIAPVYSALLRYSSTIGFSALFLSDPRINPASHSDDLSLFFNNTVYFKARDPVLSWSDYGASKFLINVFSNYLNSGKPMYKTKSGELVNVWNTIGSYSMPRYLDITDDGARMINDPFKDEQKFWTDAGLS